MVTRHTPDPSSETPGAPAPDQHTVDPARSVVKRLAGLITGVIKEVTGKIAGKNMLPRNAVNQTGSSTASIRAGGSLDNGGNTTGSSSVNSGNPDASTRTGALAPGTTSEDVQKLTSQNVSSGEVTPDDDIKDQSATDVKQHYFQDQHLHAGPPPPQPARELPDEYGETTLVLMVRDPEWIYAYWEVSDATREELNLPRNGQVKRQLLRVYKVTGRSWPEEPAHYFFDVEINADARSWYISLPEANEHWCAELGFIDESDNYITVVRSNPVHTPRNSISPEIDSEWMTVQESFEKITRLSGANLEERLRGDSKTASESILRMINRQLTSFLPGERIALNSGIFSSESAIKSRARDFWLHVHTELILYGATEPDAKVTVQGKSVELNDDGTFSIRYALPDGIQTLEVRAQNAAGDMEEVITPVVERTTR